MDLFIDIKNLNCIRLFRFCKVVFFFIPATMANDLRIRRIYSRLCDVYRLVEVYEKRGFTCKNILYISKMNMCVLKDFSSGL